MVCQLIHDPMLLALRSREATREDLSVADDLLETLLHHRESCVGMAANMIGKPIRIIAFFDGDRPIVLFNPEILRRDGPYEAEEGCLSLLGSPRKCQRFRKIKVRYQTREFQTRLKTFEGFTAQIIQHEVDHCQGILI